MLKLNQSAPDFELPNQEGKLIRLSALRGHKVVMFAFPKAGTLGCTSQACSFRDALTDFESDGAVVLGISADSQIELRVWRGFHKLKYDLLSDPKHQVLEPWGAWGMSMIGLFTLPMLQRSYWAIDEAGILQEMKIGISPNESVEAARRFVQTTNLKIS